MIIDAITKKVIRALSLFIRDRARKRKKPLRFDSKALRRLETVRKKPQNIYAPASYRYDADIDLSVIVPVYNVDKYLDECLAGLLQGNVPVSFEVIAVNDGSTDGSKDILSKWEGLSAKLRVIDQPNGGLSMARNTGLDASRGRYIAFVDSDDVFPIRSMIRLIASLETGSDDYASGTYQRVAEDGSPIGDIAFVSTMMVPWGRVYRRDVWSDIRFPIGCWYEDLISPYLIEPRYNGLDVDTDPYLYRKRPGSIVSATSTDPRGIDSFWVTSYMLSECRRIGIKLDQGLFDTTIEMMGPLLVGRASILSESGIRDLFLACCETIREQSEFNGLYTKLGNGWNDVAEALQTGNFSLWASGVAAIAIHEGSLGRRAIMRLLKAALRFW